jgi:Spy/CpxP family protein refolding chaperone
MRISRLARFLTVVVAVALLSTFTGSVYAGPGKAEGGKKAGGGAAGRVQQVLDTIRTTTDKMDLSADVHQKIRDRIASAEAEVRDLIQNARATPNAKGNENKAKAPREQVREVITSAVHDVAALLNPEQQQQLRDAVQTALPKHAAGSDPTTRPAKQKRQK